MVLGSRCDHMKTVQVILQIEPTLKAAGEKAASAERRSLTGLIEKLLTDYCKKRALPIEFSALTSPANGSPKAAEMAASTIDDIGDKTAPPEENSGVKDEKSAGRRNFATCDGNDFPPPPKEPPSTFSVCVAEGTSFP